ncbi:MAG: DUF1566 domain-containing protein, partial [Candidatus Aminicenantaceae bacterium]
ADITYKTALPVRQFITAGSSDEIVPDKSLFKECFLEALKGDADANSDGYVTGSELGMYLESKVVNYSRNAQHPQYGKIRNIKLDKGDFVFVLGSKKVTIPAEDSKPVFPKKTEKLDLSSIEESTRLRKEALKRWDDWQSKMNSDFRNVENIEKNSVSTREEKKAAWEQFLRHYDENNPYITKDDELRQRAEQRIKELSKPEISVGARVSLRSIPRSLSFDKVKSMLKMRNFFDFGWNKSGSFENEYESKTINGDKVVLDHATGLMWHRSGSEECMIYDKVKQWVDELNRKGYAGYSDWRLPTLEEGASLLEERRKMNREDLHIDPVFSMVQGWIWTSDTAVTDRSGVRMWVAHFYHGSRYPGTVDDIFYVRPVRSAKRKALSELNIAVRARVSLRSVAWSLSKNEVGEMLKRKNFFSKRYDWNKNYCNPRGDFANEYEVKTIRGDKVVLDHATGLMWHPSGLEKYLTYDKANKWIDELNRRGYAGYSDWRLPTLEEGASLIERSEMNGELYIDREFSAKQLYIWTGDMLSDSSGRAWVVNFFYGSVVRVYVDYFGCVRPVRSGR